MKLQTYFYLFIGVILMIVAGYASRQLTIKEYQNKIAALTEFQNQQTIKQNTQIIKGEADRKKQIADLVCFYQTEIGKLNYDLAHMHPDEGQEIIPWNVLIDFVPDPLPEVITIIKEVFKAIDITSETKYSYSDVPNAYQVNFNIKYQSNADLFTITPENIVSMPQRPIIRKRTTISAIYFANNSGGLCVQYDILPFLNVGGVAGWAEEPLVGILVGIRF